MRTAVCLVLFQLSGITSLATEIDIQRNAAPSRDSMLPVRKSLAQK